jgi:hypothetical protein
MTRQLPRVLSAFIASAVLAAVSIASAQTTPSGFTSEPDKSMAAAHESFLKGNMKKASEQIHKAAVYVRSESGKVAKDAQAGVKKAGDELDKLSAEVKKGAVKSGDQLTKAFAQTDHALAGAWHATADQTKKAGKDSTAALKKSAAGLEGAAKWSGTQLQTGAQASVDGLKKAGKGVKLGAEDVGKFFTGIGEGIADVGKKLTS